MRVKSGAAACVLIAACLVVGTAGATTSYALTDLGASEWAFDVNNLGQVVGPYNPDVAYPSNARVINDHTEVAWDTLRGDHAFVWSGGVEAELGTLGGAWVTVHDINNLCRVVGGSSTASGNYMHPYVWEGGVMTELAMLPGTYWGVATAINDLGCIAGVCGTYPTTHGFLLRNGKMTDLGVIGDTAAGVLGMNERCQIVGASTLSGAMRPFLWENGVMRDLGSLGGYGEANDINELGQIVGRSQVQVVGGAFHAFLWEGGTMFDLNSLVSLDPGWVLTSAQAINDHGWIVGEMVDPAGGEHAYLLTPVPEPGALMLTGLGVVALLLRARRRAVAREGIE